MDEIFVASRSVDMIHRDSYMTEYSDTDTTWPTFTFLDSQIMKRKAGGSDTGSIHEAADFGYEDFCAIIPKADDQSPPGSLQHSGVYPCKYCQRKFVSGRALGGHMRAHASVLPVEPQPSALSNKHQTASEPGHQHSNLQGKCILQKDRSSSQGLIGHQFRRKKTASASSGRLHKLKSSSHGDMVSGNKMDDNETSFKVSQISEINENSDNETSADSCVHSPRTELENSDLALKDRKFQAPLYTLRRNPKPSRRFADQQDAPAELTRSLPASKKSFEMSRRSEHSCSECGREFSSWRGVCGHMRCHPERDWRGRFQSTMSDKSSQEDHKVMPEPVLFAESCKTKQLPAFTPSNDQRKESGSERAASITRTSSSDTDSETDSIEAAYIKESTESTKLRSWMTRKRSKRSRQMIRSIPAETYEASKLAEQKNQSTPTDIKEDTDMAYCLVMLASTGKLSQGELAHIKRKRIESIQSIDIEANSAANNLHPEHGNLCKKVKYIEDEKPISLKHTTPKELVMAEEENIGENIQTSDIIKHECARCGKTFKSHQALGGHRASHKKMKGCYARSNTASRVDPDRKKEELTDGDLPRALEENERISQLNQLKEEQESSYMTCNANALEIHQVKPDAHECPICCRSFMSGQALGGHKRSHGGGAIPSDDRILTSKRLELSMRQTLHSRKTMTDADPSQAGLSVGIYKLGFLDCPDPDLNLCAHSFSDES